MRQQLLGGEFLPVKDMSDEQLAALVSILHTMRAKSLTSAARSTKTRGGKIKALPKKVSVEALAAQLTEEERALFFKIVRKGGKA